MLKNYLTVALRNLRKYTAYSFINVTGLSIGLACFVLILLFVQDEHRYDRHHERADRIYRLAVDVQARQGFQQTAQSGPAWAPALVDEFPEVVSAVRVKPPNQAWMVGRSDRLFYERGMAFADSTIFDVFTVPLLRGSPATALDAPFTMVLGETTAKKYFGDEDPLGRTVTLDNQYDFEVTGIMADMPRTGHFRFDFLASMATLDQVPIYAQDFSQFQFPIAYTYLLLAEGADDAALEEKLGPALERYVDTQVPVTDAGFAITGTLQPLTDIHLHSHRENEIEPNGDAAAVYIFLASAFFILLIASINFMNLATARSARRAREVGMRKVAGAQRGQLIVQFLGESVLLGVLGLVLALGLIALALPAFRDLTGKAIAFAELGQPAFALGLVGVTLGVGVLAGLYPAFFLSAFRPADVLKGTTSAGRAGQKSLRKALIVFQFAISIVLIVCTGIVYTQMQYVRTKKLGLDKEYVVVIQLTDPTPRTLYRAYKQAILGDPNVVRVSASLSAPARVINQAALQPVTAAQDENWFVHAYFSDYDLVETLGMELVTGRTHSRDFPADTLGALLLTETAARDFGWDDPRQALGRELKFPGPNPDDNPPLRVIGVVKDFHSHSVREAIVPTMITYANEQAYNYMFVRIRPEDVPQTVAMLEQTWRRIVPSYAFDYSFLDEDFDALYRREGVLGTLLGYFAGLTIFIACLGLFGLASFTAEQRTKEIGVRKVLGASVTGLVVLLSKEFTKLVLLAFMVAVPVAYVAMDRWLSGFAYHVDISWRIFLIAGSLSLAVALLTVSYQSIRAALTNPVETLRGE